MIVRRTQQQLLALALGFHLLDRGHLRAELDEALGVARELLVGLEDADDGHGGGHHLDEEDELVAHKASDVRELPHRLPALAQQRPCLPR